MTGSGEPDPKAARAPLPTGQELCYDEAGREIPCDGSGQDAERRRSTRAGGERFDLEVETVRDRLTGLDWLRDAGAAEYPLSWQEALDFVAGLNRRATAGHSDWRLPNRRELRSLVSPGYARPALPLGHPFLNVARTWYWTSTTAAINPAYAWYLDLDGARMFYGSKEQYFLAWPVRGAGNGLLPRTGQRLCHDSRGREVACAGTGQDGEFSAGRPWPEPRFEVRTGTVVDRLTGLEWRRQADLTSCPVTWEDALAAAAGLNRGGTGRPWRLPDINELESLVDCAASRPALPSGHPFTGVADVYWSSTTSAYETDWAWALYLEKGACGVGRKEGPWFRAWAVREAGDG